MGLGPSQVQESSGRVDVVLGLGSKAEAAESIERYSKCSVLGGVSVSGTIADHIHELLSFLNLIECRVPLFNFRALIGQAEGKVISVWGLGT